MTRTFSIERTNRTIQLYILALVLHLWLHMLGQPRTGRVAAFWLVIAAFVLHLAPVLAAAYGRLRDRVVA